MSRRRGGDGMSTGVLIALVVIATLLCAALAVVMYMDKKGMLGGDAQDAAVADEAGEEAGAAGNGQDVEPAVVTGDKLQASNGSSLIPDDKDVDIAALRTKNPDIYAWLYIPEAGIDEPVLQNSEDINYYVTHNADGQSDENGAVFTQMLNSKDFNDNLTVIYGHNSDDDKGFSNLKVFGDPEYFDEYPYIYVYTQDKLLVYQTFAAYESDDKLIIMFYGTQDNELYQIYLSNIEQYAGLSGRLNKNIWPGAYDKTLTLSTGVIDKEDRRFLVQAKLVEAIDR